MDGNVTNTATGTTADNGAGTQQEITLHRQPQQPQEQQHSRQRQTTTQQQSQHSQILTLTK